MPPSVGILAFGSLIDNPGKEIEAALVGRKANLVTPFSVEFARTSKKRGGAPTLVPVKRGGRPVRAQILPLDTTEEEAKDCLWRRETDKVGEGGHYVHRTNPGPDTLIIDLYENFEGVPIVLAARFAATIAPLTAKHLADLAITSVASAEFGRDGITYLINAKRDGITTPLSASYEKEILRRTETADLKQALHKLRTGY
jgi:hypothetical protein